MYFDFDPFGNLDAVFARKVLKRLPGGQLRVYLENPPMSFAELRNTDLLDTADLCYLFGCARRTLYRWMGERGLRPYCQVGRELYFTKGDIVKWFRSNRPSAPGRPKVS